MSAARSISASGMSSASSDSLASRSVRKLRSPVGVDKRDQPAGLAIRVADKMWRDPDRLQARCLAFNVSRADAGDEVDAHAERRKPCRLIGC